MILQVSLAWVSGSHMDHPMTNGLMLELGDIVEPSVLRRGVACSTRSTHFHSESSSRLRVESERSIKIESR